MDSLVVKGVICCVVSVLLCAVALLFSKKYPNHISNGFLIEIGLLIAFSGICYLLSFNTVFRIIYIIGFILYSLMYLVLGGGLIGIGVVTVKKEGKNLTHMLPFVWGIFLIVNCLIQLWSLLPMVGSNRMVMAETFFSMLLSYIPFALLGVFISNEICRKSPKAPETNYIIVLGCGISEDGKATPLLRGRLDKAIEIYRKGRNKAKIIVSGGQGEDEVVSEASAMADYLISQGIDESSILLENRSTTTEENLLFSKEIMKKDHGITHCTVVTSSYHTLRAAMFARRAGLDADCAGGKTAKYYFPAAFFREYIALIIRNKYSILIFILLTVIRFILINNNILSQTFI